MTFVKFESYYVEGSGDDAVSEVKGWLRLPAQPHHYLELSIRVTGPLEEPTLLGAQVSHVPGDLAYPYDVLNFNGLAKIQFASLLAFSLALISSAIGAVSFTLCVLNWKKARSYLWAVLSWVGISPVQVELSSGEWRFHWIGITAPPGKFSQDGVNFWFTFYDLSWHPLDIPGQLAVFSLPLGLIYILRNFRTAFG